MTKRIGGVFKAMTDMQAGMSVLVLTLTAGLSLGAAGVTVVAGFWELPDVVAELQSDGERLGTRQDTIYSDVKDVKCMLRALIDSTPLTPTSCRDTFGG